MSTAAITTLSARGRQLFPGLDASVVVAAAASFLSEHYAAPVMLFALLLGMAMNFLAAEGACNPGIEFAARRRAEEPRQDLTSVILDTSFGDGPMNDIDFGSFFAQLVIAGNDKVFSGGFDLFFQFFCLFLWHFLPLAPLLS